MSRFKVALFTGNYNHIRDGVSLTLNRLVAFLIQNDVEVLVFGPTIKEPALEHKGELVAVPSVQLPGRPEYRFTTSFSSRARKELENFKPDLVHIATPDLLGYKALKIGLKSDVPVVSSYHTHFASYLKYYRLSFLEPLMWKYLRWFYENCEQVYVPTPSMAEVLIEKKIDTDLKIWARGIDTKLFNPSRRDQKWRSQLGFQSDDIVVTFVSRLVWEKNLRLFADVVKKTALKYPKLKPMIVGDGPAGEEMKKILPEAVFTGFLKGNELATAYSSSDIFFFPSDTETFGNVTLEAMASGLPCLVADAVGSRSLVEHEKNGFLVPVEKEDLFTEYLERLIRSKDLRSSMSVKSVEKSGEYSWQTINNTLMNYYQEVLEGKK